MTENITQTDSEDKLDIKDICNYKNHLDSDTKKNIYVIQIQPENKNKLIILFNNEPRTL